MRLSFCQSARLFGSNTAQRMPSWIDSSRNRNRRRMLTYCQLRVGARVRARAPHDRPAAAGKTRTTLMPCRFSWPCSIVADAPLDAERAVDESRSAGALCTPRVASLRAIDAAHVAGRRHEDRRSPSLAGGTASHG